MALWWKTVWLGVVCLLKGFVTQAANPSSEQELIRELLTGYDPNGRPVLIPDTTIKVEFGIEIVQIIEVDTRYQTIKTNVWIRQRWNNDILNWNATGFQGLKTIRLEANSVWTPDVVLYNNGDSQSKSGTEKFKTRVIVNNDGSIAWFSPAMYITTCSMDISYFPFDQQTCRMKFGSWTFMENQVDVVPSEKPLTTDKYIESTEWDLVSAWKQRSTANYTCCEKPISFIEVEMMIRRKPLFYAFNLITPCLIFLSVILLGFCLPPESKERITLNITVLLAMAVFVQLMAKSLPRNADTTPLLGHFYITIMIEIALSLVATCFVLNLHHRNLGLVPTWVDIIVLHWLAAVLCVRRPSKDYKVLKKDLELEKISVCLNAHNKRAESGSDITIIPTMNGHAQGALTAVQKYRTKVTYSDGLPLSGFMRSRNMSTSKPRDSLASDISLFKINRKAKQQHENLSLKWRHVAMVIDRLLFWLFVVTIVISISAVFKERIKQSFGENYNS